MSNSQNKAEDEKSNQPGILDKIIDSQQHALLQNFEPAVVASKALSLLKDRDRTILAKRFGLLGFSRKTLEAIGKEHSLTRERVRQIEKESIKFLRSKLNEHQLAEAIKVLSRIIADCGKIIREVELIKTVSSQATEEEKSSILFLLNVAEELLEVKENDMVNAAWASVDYNHEFFKNIIETAKQILKSEGKPIHETEFIEKLKQTHMYNEYNLEVNDRLIKNYLDLTKEIEKNPFEEYGLSHWEEITPRDVGDKAYIVMKHHGKPEHYTVITEMINKHGFDKRTAHKETVHNELIKDSRFVLVGRGIYALTEWGYKKGVVSDVLIDILKKSKGPMAREEIVDEVMKKRFVKRNTVLVALSNKKLFSKVAKNKYDLLAR